MAFRNLIVKDRCKLEYALNYLVCRKNNEETRILLDEIKLVVIDSLQVSITTSLIAMCAEKKIKIIFVDEKHNPCAELVNYQNNFYSYRKIKEQISISQNNKDFVWKQIVKEKINNQAYNLKEKHYDEYLKLIDYSNEIENGDITNREGHAAKVYFNALFGTKFNRDQDNEINKYLNYGYSILLSSINREIKMYGYLTELGIHHIGESNPFNFSCDLIEPLRPLVDAYVINNIVNEDNYKLTFVEMLSKNVTYNDKDFFLDNAIHLFVGNIMDVLLNKTEEEILFIKYEL